MWSCITIFERIFERNPAKEYLDIKSAKKYSEENPRKNILMKIYKNVWANIRQRVIETKSAKKIERNFEKDYLLLTKLLPRALLEAMKSLIRFSISLTGDFRSIIFFVFFVDYPFADFFAIILREFNSNFLSNILLQIYFSNLFRKKKEKKILYRKSAKEYWS